MFRKTLFKLTIFYSALFLLLFWLFSFGLYVWMNNSFGEGYISQVQHRQGIDTDSTSSTNAKVVTIAGDIALDQLLRILLTLNGLLLLIIPFVSWYLAKRTLTPVQVVHEQQKQFVSDASHEMRTPLSIITGEIDVALGKKRTEVYYRHTLLSTREEALRLSHLVENLLFLARDDQGVQTLTFQEVDITDVINEVMQSLLPKSNEKQLAVKLVSMGLTSTPITLGYSPLLYQLLYNLLDNALNYTVGKGTITITLSDSKQTISIAIKDTGIGIEKGDLEKIFQRFYRADQSRSVTKGYGLGLSIVKSILAKHNGQLYVDSVVHTGSTFTVVLPKV